MHSADSALKTVMERKYPNTLISFPGAMLSPELKAFSIV